MTVPFEQLGPEIHALPEGNDLPVRPCDCHFKTCLKQMTNMSFVCSNCLFYEIKLFTKTHCKLILRSVFQSVPVNDLIS